MIKVYIAPACSSCDKAQAWLSERGLKFEVINLFTANLSTEDFFEIFSLCENGTEDVISKRSRAYQRLNLDFDTMTLHELAKVIEENRTLLRRPLILDDKRLQVGYNEDDIRKFLPREVRRVALHEMEGQIQGEVFSTLRNVQ